MQGNKDIKTQEIERKCVNVTEEKRQKEEDSRRQKKWIDVVFKLLKIVDHRKPRSRNIDRQAVNLLISVLI